VERPGVWQVRHDHALLGHSPHLVDCFVISLSGYWRWYTESASPHACRYYGDASSVQQKDLTNYGTWDAAATYGWGAFSCTQQRHHYICSIPAAQFGCAPPPNPPPPPTAPPVPQAPPAPPHCAPPQNDTFLCLGSSCYGSVAAVSTFTLVRPAVQLDPAGACVRTAPTSASAAAAASRYQCVGGGAAPMRVLTLPQKLTTHV
jgi:hypothetical protein